MKFRDHCKGVATWLVIWGAVLLAALIQYG